MRLIGVRGLALGVVAVLFLAGCGGNKEEADKKAVKQTSTTLPKECADVDIKNTQTLPELCADAVFTMRVKDKGSKELKSVEADRRLGFVHGMCAYAAVVGQDPKSTPSYSELLTSTSKSWGVDKSVVEEVIGLADVVCPGTIKPLLALADKTGKLTVEMSVSGPGKIDVTYTMADGSDFDDQVTGPWEHSVVLDKPTDFRLAVRSQTGSVNCRISVNGKELSKATSKKGAEVKCEASESKITAAAR